jgi:hypothetical protein
MADSKYDSVLVGYTDEPSYNDDGQLMSWRVKLTEDNLKDILEKYLASRNEKGQGGNAYLTLFMSKNGTAHTRVYDPNSEAAKEYRKARAEQKAATVADDLPF